MPEATAGPSLAERFWSHAPGPETEDLPEPARSAKVIDNFLTALSHLENLEQGGGRAAPVLVAMLRRAEVEGDPSYASPEQLRGEQVDVRSVVFSLGVVLFERVTGRHPFGAENNRPRRVARIRRGEMGSGVNSFPSIAGGLRAVLVRAMSPFAEERYADLRELRDALRGSTEERPAPRLPGASAELEVSEPTRVIERSTEFGQELMKVVSDHDDGRSARRAGRTSAPPSASGAAPSARAPRTPTPAGPAQAAISAAAAEVTSRAGEGDKAASVATSVATSSAAPAAEKSPVLHAQPWPRYEAGTPTAEARPRTEPDAPPRPRTVAEPPLPRRLPTGLIAAGGAIAGAAITLAVVLWLRPGAPRGDRPAPAPSAASMEPAAAPPTIAAAPPAPAPAASGAIPAPAPVSAAAPVDAPTPVRVDAAPPAPAAVPPPPAPSAAAATGTLVEVVRGAVTPCLDPAGKPRVFGLSLAIGRAGVQKAYFGTDDPLSKAERACIGAAVKGLVGSDAAPGDVELRVRVDGAAVDVAVRTPKKPA